MAGLDDRPMNGCHGAERVSALTEVEIRVEACLRRLLPEGDIREFDGRQRRILELSGQWSECVERFGPDSAAAIGCIEHGLIPAAYDCDPEDLRVYRCAAGRWWLSMRLESYRELLNATTRAEALVVALEDAPAEAAHDMEPAEVAACTTCKGTGRAPNPTWWRSKKYSLIRPCPDCAPDPAAARE